MVIETQKDWNLSTTAPNAYALANPTVLTKTPGGIQPQHNVEVLMNVPQPQLQQLSQCVYQDASQAGGVFTGTGCTDSPCTVPQQAVQYTVYSENSAPSFVVESADQYTGAAPTMNYKAPKPRNVVAENTRTLSGVRSNMNTTISLEDLAAVHSHDIVQPSVSGVGGMSVGVVGVQRNSPVTVQAIADSTTGSRQRATADQTKGKVEAGVAGQVTLPTEVVYDTLTVYDTSGVDTANMVVYDSQQVEPQQQAVGEQVYLMNAEGSTFIVQGDLPLSALQPGQETFDNNTQMTDGHQPSDQKVTTDIAPTRPATEVVVQSKPPTVRTVPKMTTPATTKLTVKKKEADACPQYDDLNHRPVPHALKPVPGVSSFQNSFLSFLQGRKQETLSSVTASTVSKKPVLPKYIPLPKSTAKPPSDTEKTVDVSTPQKSSNNGTTAESSTQPVTVTKKVGSNSVASGDNKKAVVSTPKAQAVSTLMSGGSSIRERRPKKSGRRLSGTPKQPSVSDDVDPAEEGEVVAPPVAPHVRPMRKAKEKVTQRLSRMKTKKNKRRSSDMSNSGSDEFVSTLSNSDENATDSDSDPSWKPSAVGADSEKRKSVSDDESRPKRGRPKKRARLSTSKSGVSQGGSDATDATKVSTLPGFQKGMFVVEKSNLEKGNAWKTQPIWKVDVSRLLKKYEPTTIGGRLVHTAKTMYTSWSNQEEANYCVVRVRHVESSENEDTIEIIEVAPPQPASDDQLMQPFDVYIQILLSQALEPGFLSALQNEQDDYYMGPLKTIDEALAECKTRMLEILHWTSTFTEAVEYYPYIHVIQSSTLKDHCQACEDEQQEAVKSVMLSGNSYDRNTLVTNADELPQLKRKMFAVGLMTSLHVTAYHSLHHTKFRLYQTCVAKVNWLKSKNVKEHSDILEQCLQDREWIQKLYKNLKDLQRQSYTVKSST